MIKGLERVDTTGALKLPNSDDNCRTVLEVNACYRR